MSLPKLSLPPFPLGFTGAAVLCPSTGATSLYLQHNQQQLDWAARQQHSREGRRGGLGIAGPECVGRDLH